MKNVLLITLSLCSSYSTLAQALIPRFETISVNDGLPHSSVYSILQDKIGFMWFGTADGLCRYDGNTLISYKYTPTNKKEAANNFVRGKMLEDKKGNIWYCNESGIYKWDILTEEVTKAKAFHKETENGSQFQSIYLDDHNKMWMLNITLGICMYNIATGEFTRYPFTFTIDYSNLFISYCNFDKKGNIWFKIGMTNEPFKQFNILTHTYSTEFLNNPPQAIFFEDNTRILAYDEKLIYLRRQDSSETIILKQIDNKPISFHSFDGRRDNYGRLWMTARGNGLFYYDEINKLFRSFRHHNSKIKSLPFDLTTCLFIDRNQNLWIGIDGGGVSKIDLKQPRFNLFPLSEGDHPVLNDYFTKCFYEDEKGRIWFGSQTNGLNIFDPVTQLLKNYQYREGDKKSLPGNMVGSITKDLEGNTWIGSSGGFSKFDENSGTSTSIYITGLPKLYPLLNNFVYKTIQLKNKDLLLATLLGLISVKKKNGFYQGKYFKNAVNLSSSLTDVVEMPDGIIYATSPGVGLVQLQPIKDSFRTINVYLKGVDLRSVKKDESNKTWLWIGSGIGLIHFNTITQNFQVFNEKSGMLNSYVYGSIEDAKGNLWISTNKGLSYFNRRENTFNNYTYQDGLQSNEFNTQAFYKSNTGVFYFGGIKGFNWFKPGSVNKEKINPVAAITSIQINEIIFKKDSTFNIDRIIYVPHDKNDFNFKFAALDYTRPEANNLRYMLEGWDASWVTADNNSARYSNLPPGDYTLRVKASNAAGEWSEEEKIRLIINAPFWKRPWFVSSLLLILLVTIIYLTYNLSQLKAKRKLRLLEKQIAVDAERNRISVDMHDEIGSGITHIALLSELLQTQKKDQEGMNKDIHTIGTSARKLVQTMSEIIWALNPENDTLESLLTYTREQSQQYFEPLPVHFTVDYPDTVPDIKLSNAQRRNLYLVTREALNNAMKHSGGDTIKLKLEIMQKEFCFTITDNGKGFTMHTTKSGHNGTRIMKKRMEDIGGTVEWLELCPGTTVRYCVTF